MAGAPVPAVVHCAARPPELRLVVNPCGIRPFTRRPVAAKRRGPTILEITTGCFSKNRPRPLPPAVYRNSHDRGYTVCPFDQDAETDSGSQSGAWFRVSHTRCPTGSDRCLDVLIVGPASALFSGRKQGPTMSTMLLGHILRYGTYYNVENLFLGRGLL